MDAWASANDKRTLEEYLLQNHLNEQTTFLKHRVPETTCSGTSGESIMKPIVLSLLFTLALTGILYGQKSAPQAKSASSTPNSNSSLFIGQNPETGDEVMSIGPAQREPASDSTNALIITPEIILYPTIKASDSTRPKVRKQPNAPQTP